MKDINGILNTHFNLHIGTETALVEESIITLDSQDLAVLRTPVQSGATLQGVSPTL